MMNREILEQTAVYYQTLLVYGRKNMDTEIRKTQGINYLQIDPGKVS